MQRRLVVAFGIAVCFEGACSSQVRLNVTLGANECRHIEVPGETLSTWSADPATAKQNPLNLSFQTDDMTGLEFRVSGGKISELYFAAQPSPGQAAVFGPYSKEKYALNIHNSEPVRPIKPEDWARAGPLVRGNVRAAGDAEIGDDDKHDLSYAGKRCAKSGEHLSLATASASDRLIAVFSYDGQQHPEQASPGVPGVPGRTKHPMQGELYVDIYNVATGKKLIAMKGPFQNGTGNNWFLTAFFLEDRYFFFNSGQVLSEIRQFMICELPTPAVQPLK